MNEEKLQPEYQAFDGLSGSNPRWLSRVLSVIRERTQAELVIFANLAAISFIATTLGSSMTTPWSVVGIVLLAALCPISTAVVMSSDRIKHATTKKVWTDNTS